MRLANMRPVSRTGFLTPILMMGLLFVAACDQNAAQNQGQSGAAATPAADYSTRTEHFAALQNAGLGADYSAFATHLRAGTPEEVVAQLQASFNGAPFDVYTQRSVDRGATHRRVIELRGTRGRLYLFLQLDKVTGGWSVAGYQIGRNRDVILAKL